MGRLMPPGWQPLSDAGAVMSGATATWSITGTSTAKDTYSNKGLTSANANPVVADANGRFGAIFGLEDEGYRLVLKNAAGTTIYTLDEVFAGSAAVDELLRRKEIVRSPFDHAAVGDGSTNDAVALAAALAAADGVLDLEGKTYRCDSALTLRSGITIRNGTIDFSNASIASGLSGAGTAGSTTVVTTATAGTQTITAAGHSGYTAGDLLRLRSANTIATGHQFAELFRVENTSGNDILVDGAILGTYTTTPLVEEITPISDIRLENLTVVAPSAGYAIDLSLCERVRMYNVRCRTTAAAESIRIISCYGVILENCSIGQKTTSESGGIIVGDASRDVLIKGCHIERALQAIEIGDDYGSFDGVTRDVRVEGCTLAWCGQIEIAAGARYIDIIDNTILCDIAPSTASTVGILVGGADVTIRGNTIRDCEGVSITVTMQVNADYVIIDGNSINGGETHGIRVTAAGFTIQNLRISDNEIAECAGSFILIDGETIENLNVSGNECRASTVAGIAINIGHVGGSGPGCARISGNVVDDCTAITTGISYTPSTVGKYMSSIDGNLISSDDVANVTAISVSSAHPVSILGNQINRCDVGVTVTSADALTTIGNNTIENLTDTDDLGITVSGGTAYVYGNTISGPGRGIFLDECTSIHVAGNRVATTGIGVEIDATTQEFNGCCIAGNWIDSAGDGIEIDASDATGSLGVAISGNYINAAGQCIEITGIITGIAINGNACVKDNDTGANISIAGDGAANITMCTVVGNHLHNGTYGIDISNNTTSYHSANTFSSMATGNTNGTFAAAIFST